jgi:hypothetical protein
MVVKASLCCLCGAWSMILQLIVDLLIGKHYSLDRLPEGYALMDKPRPSNTEIVSFGPLFEQLYPLFFSAISFPRLRVCAFVC